MADDLYITRKFLFSFLLLFNHFSKLIELIAAASVDPCNTLLIASSWFFT